MNIKTTESGLLELPCGIQFERTAAPKRINSAATAPKQVTQKLKPTPKGASGFDITKPKKEKTVTTATIQKNDATEQTAQTAAPTPSKKAVIVGLLSSGRGATLSELVTATGWQKHSVHGQLANMRKAGANITTEVLETEGKKERVYVIKG